MFETIFTGTFWQRNLVHVGDYELTLAGAVLFVGIFVVAKLVLVGIGRIFNREVKAGKITKENATAIRQLLSYLIYIIAAALALESVGVSVTILIAGSAALLVGVGLGLQQLFLDVASGIILLFDPNVNIGDVVKLSEGTTGKIRRVGLRVTNVLTTENVITVVPNSKLTTSTLVNLTHSDITTRFSVTVGVAYGSDVDKVTRILLECADKIDEAEKDPDPSVLFTDFGDSALMFELRFWCKNVFQTSSVQSDLRYSIERRFREEGIVIPFPQRDLHIKSGSL